MEKWPHRLLIAVRGDYRQGRIAINPLVLRLPGGVTGLAACRQKQDGAEVFRRLIHTLVPATTVFQLIHVQGRERMAQMARDCQDLGVGVQGVYVLRNTFPGWDWLPWPPL